MPLAAKLSTLTLMSQFRVAAYASSTGSMAPNRGSEQSNCAQMREPPRISGSGSMISGTRPKPQRVEDVVLFESPGRDDCAGRDDIGTSEDLAGQPKDVGCMMPITQSTG